MIFPLFNKDIVEVLTVFSVSHGSRFQRKEIQEKTKMHNVNLDHVITILLHTGVLQKEKRLLSLNIEKGMSIVNLICQDYKILKCIFLEATQSLCITKTQILISQ